MSQCWLASSEKLQPIVKIPLQFHFQPVQILSKQLTKLNSPYNYRIHYLGPRYDDSAALHKKYANKQGYSFNDKQINKNNNVFSETMGQNQFYKNQVFYRAFEGMNPTIDKQEELQFNSRFQSGNLDCVVKVGPDQYDLFLRIDSNTRGHLFWFYFEVSNCRPDAVVKFNICNMTKSIELYQKGFKPYCCTRNVGGQYKKWSQDPCFDVAVGYKKLRYQFIYERVKVRKLIQLSFKYKFQSREPVRFAYCIPYTYSQMLNDVRKIQSLKLDNVIVGSLGRSLTGLQIPMIILGKDQDKSQKPVVVCIGRLHPGQSNGSHVLSGLINFICTSTQAEYIRKKLITVFIPMLNPDGVILGNSRTCATGKDMNRQFKTRNKVLYPEICALKILCNKILQTNDIQMFFDFHGHSRKKNMFCFGPNYNITQPQYYRARVLPKFLSQNTSIFRYFGCDYSLPAGKSSTARAVMLQQFTIPYVYAMEASIGQYFEYEFHKVMPFGLAKWLELGSETGKALKQYFESIEQFSQFYKSKTSDLDQIIKPTSSPIRNAKIPPLKPATTSQKPRNLVVKQKDIKLLKIFEQIKVSQQERRLKKKEESDNESDSQNDDDNLEGKKQVQFESMVLECIETEKKRKQRLKEFDEIKTKKNKKQPTPKKGRKKPKLEFNTNIMKQIMRSVAISTGNTSAPTTPIQISTQSPASNRRLWDKRINRSEDNTSRNYSISHNKQMDSFFMANKISRTNYEDIVTQHIYFDDILPESTADKSKKNNLNLRMFNFSKVIEETEGRQAASSGRKGRGRYLASLREVNTLDSQSNIKSDNPDGAHGSLNKICVEQCLQVEGLCQSPQKDEQVCKSGSSKKVKGLYPASFYRIKYQNYQKRKKLIKQRQQLMQDNKFIEEDLQAIERHRKKESLFLNIRKFDNK